MADDNPTRIPEMIERVAKAIHEATSLPVDMCVWETLPKTVKWGWYEWAAAALKAMREPTEAMTTVGNEWDCAPQADAVWRAMIDAALGE